MYRPLSKKQLVRVLLVKKYDLTVIILTVIWVIVSSSPFIKCDKNNFTTVAVEIQNDKLLKRFVRHAKDYTSSILGYHKTITQSDNSGQSRSSRNSGNDNDSGSNSNNNNNNGLNDGKLSYSSAYGLPIKYEPQQFINKLSHSYPVLMGSSLNDLSSFNLMTEQRKDICQNHCSCERGRNAFLTVHCDFQKNPQLSTIFDKKFKVPYDATVINITLGRYTQFRLDSGFFLNNTVNSIIIQGQYREGEQIEITTKAFQGNNGPYPEINFFNIYTIIIRTKAFSANCKLKIYNSNEVILYADAFENAHINGLLINIKDLRIGEKAFNSAQAKLRIESSNIDHLYRFDASLHEIRFVNCTIGTINNGTFDVIKINTIIFESCRIDVIKARAITEKLFSEHVSIMDASIGFIESEAIYGSGITELILTNNRIDTIHENAIYVTSINVTIAHNNIKHLGQHWLKVKGWSNVVVEKNQFGVFGGLMLKDVMKPVKCRFEGNSLTQPLPGSLNITNPHCILREISINTPCRCNLDWLERLSARDLRSEIYCTIDDKLGNCFNSTTFNTLKYLHEVCDDKKTILDCVANKNLKKIDGHFFTPEELEKKNRRLPELIMILAGSLIFLLLITTFIIILICRCRNGKWQMFTATNNTIQRHLHVFSDDERLVCQQTLQMIQKKYPEIYRNVNERLTQMLNQNLSEDKCIKLTSEIVNQLAKVNNPGTDFVAFNRLLTDHLQKPSPTTSNSEQTAIYSEPGLNILDNTFYTSNSFSRLDQMASNSATLPLGAEHIYAEPNCAQQPLLPNEYALPADGQAPINDLYIEPIGDSENTNTNSSTAYAVCSTLSQSCGSATNVKAPQYAVPIRPKLQEPKIQHAICQIRNMPDVLTQKPLTHVQKIAQDLEVKTNFNPAAKPKDLHLITPPIYAMPDTNVKHKLLPPPSINNDITKQHANNINEFELDMRGATALPTSDGGSNHSGGSNETVKIDDVIEYADADA